ncbi:hypothetical protein N2W53_003131 [Clostridium perfringens]|nr:hypothetical protein [Clostridium perfringens]EJT6543178.1 hypothetical protein [Clostridium perfringens]EJT6568199.1 hypothetical protein [Clostridium perfringens]MBS5996141.1 hypothetical protein [Clostridium perfringens]MDU5659381.1 phage terminase small subunit [Clostridium perfringens]
MELREKAFELFKESNGNISSKKIADALGIDLNKVKYWRRKDNWKDNINRSRGAPKGNKNAIGNNGGAPKGNLNNFKHGMYIDDSKFSSKNFLAKYIPAATKNIIGEIEDAGLSSLDILWMNITTQLAAIIRSQKIMHVKSKNDLTKELKREKIKSKSKDTGKTSSHASEKELEYELQFAWDKQANFLQAQSKAIKTLEGLINSYEKLLHTNWDLATEEQKMRIEVLKSRIIKDDAKNNANSTAKLDSILGQIKERNKNE